MAVVWRFFSIVRTVEDEMKVKENTSRMFLVHHRDWEETPVAKAAHCYSCWSGWGYNHYYS